MAIVKNRATEVGDVIYIEAEVPIVGLLSLLDWTDDTEGENVTKFFEKYFRHSTDGVNWSEWIELTTYNVKQIQVQPVDTFFIEYRYTRIGSSNTGELSFDSVTLDANYGGVSCGPHYNNSLFKEYFECMDLGVLNWCINVLEKLYKKGIVPKYIERGKNNNSKEDEDYISFWKSVSCFFAMIVHYARQFGGYGSNPKVLQEYLSQWGMYLCDNSSLQQLIYLKENYYDQIRQRGTSQIFKKKNESIPVDGELLRLICYNALKDEFIFNVNRLGGTGWWVDISSPLYKGANLKAFNKAWEQVIGDLSNYPIENESYVTINSLSEEIVISGVPSGEVAGISYNIDSPEQTDFSKAIIVDSNTNYEINFCVKQSNISTAKLTLGIDAFDKDNNLVQVFEINDVNSPISSNGNMIEEKSLNLPNQEYLIRGIIYGYDVSPSNKIPNQLSIGVSTTHLRFREDVVKVIPRIILDNSSGGVSSGDLTISNLKFRAASTSYGRGFVQLPNFIDIWLKNNNTQFSEQKLEEIIRKYLVSYKSSFKINYL